MANQLHTFVPNTPEWLKPILIREAERTGLPTSLLSAQLANESIQFNEDVIFGRGKWKGGNVAGAAGVAQFIPSTARSYGLIVNNQVDERLNPEKAINAQANYMLDLLRENGSVERALSAYNSGNPDRYKDPNFRTWYGSVGETYNYVNDITGKSGVKGGIDTQKNISTYKTGIKEPDIFQSIAKAKITKPAYAAEKLPAAGPPPMPIELQPSRQLEMPKNLALRAESSATPSGQLPEVMFDVASQPVKPITRIAKTFLPEFSKRIKNITRPAIEGVKQAFTPNQTQPQQQLPQQTEYQQNVQQQIQDRLTNQAIEAARRREMISRAQMSRMGSQPAMSVMGSRPAMSAAPMASPMVKFATPSSAGARSYVVSPGETLWGIAQKTLGSGEKWKQLGFGGDPRKLPVGQVLRY